MESTYGDRSHGERPDYVRLLAEVIQETFDRGGNLVIPSFAVGRTHYVRLLAEVIQETFDRGGNLVIPSFAVGRTQEMLYFIRQIKEEKLVYGDVRRKCCILSGR